MFPLCIVLVLIGIAFNPAECQRTTGIDVSNHDGNVDWNALRSSGSSGVHFAYIRATSGTNYTDDKFNDNHRGASRVGIIRGAYHNAQPILSSGAEQANFFTEKGGGWRADNKTLPGALGLERDCSGLSVDAMVNWIRDFSNVYNGRVGRYPVIFTTTDWWKKCTGNNPSFGQNHPLWIVRYDSSPGELPTGWSSHTFWQYADQSSNPGYADEFNGSLDRLNAFTRG